MRLSSSQIQQLHDTLVEAFDKDSLEMMVRLDLDEVLDTIAAPGDNLTKAVWKLITWAERTDRIGDLIRAAYERNPSNFRVQQLHEDFAHWRSDAKPTESQPGKMDAGIRRALGSKLESVSNSPASLRTGSTSLSDEDGNSPVRAIDSTWMPVLLVGAAALFVMLFMWSPTYALFAVVLLFLFGAMFLYAQQAMTQTDAEPNFVALVVQMLFGVTSGAALTWTAHMLLGFVPTVLLGGLGTALVAAVASGPKLRGSRTFFIAVIAGIVIVLGLILNTSLPKEEFVIPLS